MKRIGITAWALASLLLLAGTQALADDGRGPPPPTAESLQACQGAQEGAACTFTVGDESVAGTCRSGPQGRPAACMPARPKGPPPEAFRACQSLAEGTSCTVSFQGRSMEGTCRRGPDAQGALACAPARMPDR